MDKFSPKLGVYSWNIIGVKVVLVHPYYDNTTVNIYNYSLEGQQETNKRCSKNGDGHTFI